MTVETDGHSVANPAFYIYEAASMPYGVVTEKEGHKADSPTQRTQKQWRQHQATKNLSGFMVLGAAWQSVDIFEALAQSLQTQDGITLSHLALLRTQELLKPGRKSIQVFKWRRFAA